eukprot:symbB.v1.2.030270.t1/scaffold3391.1/size57876/11
MPAWVLGRARKYLSDLSAPHALCAMGAGCIRATPAKRYELQVDPPQVEVPSTPKAEPLNLPTSPSRTVGELKARLRDMGWKLPANVVEKKELEALVEEAEKQKAAKDAANAAKAQTQGVGLQGAWQHRGEE